RSSKRSKAGRVVVSLTSAEPYWVRTALSSVKRHFAKADRFVTNLELPPGWTEFRGLDPSDPQQAADRAFMKELEEQTERGERLRTQVQVNLGAESRFLAKLALAVGYKILGSVFLQS